MLFSQDKVYAPTLISPLNSAINIGVDAFLLDWSSVAGAVKYEVQVDTNNNFSNPQIIIANLSATIVSELLLYGTYYNWRVRAIGEPGDTSAWSVVTRTFKTKEYPNLTLPKDVITLSNKTITITTKSDTIMVSVTPAPVYKDTITPPDSTVVINLPDTTITISITSDSTIMIITTPPGDTIIISPPVTTKIFKPSNYDAPISITLPDTTISFLPADTVKYKHDISPYFKWEKITGSPNYLAEIDTVPDFNSPFLKSAVAGNVDTIIIDLFLYGQGYFYRAKAYHSGDTSEWSMVNYFTTKQKPVLEKPAQGTASSNVTLVKELEWEAIIGSTAFQYAYSTNSNFIQSTIVNVPPSAFTISNSTNLSTRKGIVKIAADTLPYGDTIYWKARSISQHDTSLWSTHRWLTTIKTVTLTSPANGATNVAVNPTFKWKKIDGSIKYQVQYDTNSLFLAPTSSLVAHPTGTALEVSLPITTQLQSYTNYFWRVRAISSRDTSDWATASFKTQPGVDISEYSLENNISIYPNPTKGNLHINVSVQTATNYALNVSNILGQEIYKKEGNLIPILIGTQNNNIKVDLSNLNNGIYFLTIDIGDEKATRKIILDK